MRVLVGAVVLWLVLIQPNHPGAMTMGAFRLIPLELPVLLLALAAMQPPARVLRALLVLLLLASVVLKAADLAMFTAFGRGFNVVVDVPLLASGWDLGTGSMGVGMASLALAAGVLLLLGLAVLLWRGMGAWVGLFGGWRWLAGVGALVALTVAGADAARIVPVPGEAFTTRLAVERVLRVRATLEDLSRFAAAARSDPWVDVEAPLDRLGGADVRIVFVESYGRASFDNPLYAPTHAATLRAAEQGLRVAGLAMRSGWLTSPIAGGQSWLAHGTLASGLRIDGQSRYSAMLASPRRTLFHLAQEAGYRTVAVVPGITLDWPEGGLLGFQQVFGAADLGYRGRPFDWVTMPDQFTLAAADRLLTGAPTFAEVVLISSHAPWVPVAEMVPWAEVGDGRIFDAQAVSGEAPEVVWQDPDRVRDHYRRSLDYALQAAMEHAVRQAGRRTLLVVLGDHQAAPFVAGSTAREVPVHLIGPPDLVAAVEDWGWTDGLVPAAGVLPVPMETFRDRFLAAYTTAAP